MSGPNEMDIYIGGRIRKIREYRGIKREVVAGALEISSTEFGLIERGLRRLSPKQIVVIAAALRIRPSFLFGNLALQVEVEYAGALIPHYEGLTANPLESSLR